MHYCKIFSILDIKIEHTERYFLLKISFWNHNSLCIQFSPLRSSDFARVCGCVTEQIYKYIKYIWINILWNYDLLCIQFSLPLSSSDFARVCGCVTEQSPTEPKLDFSPQCNQHFHCNLNPRIQFKMQSNPHIHACHHI